MSSISYRQWKHPRFPKTYSKRRKFLASMVINWPGIIRPRTNGLFHFLKEGLVSKRNEPHFNNSN